MKKKTISFWHPVTLICTVFGVGKIPRAPGTWGSVAGVALFIAIGMQASILAVPLLFILGWIASNYYGKLTKKTDASEIVIDEVVGQLITIILGFYIANYFKINPYLTERCESCWMIKYVIWFLLFRVFDIVKRGPVGWCDRNVKNGLGVMIDDVVAGILAGLTSVLIFWLITII